MLFLFLFFSFPIQISFNFSYIWISDFFQSKYSIFFSFEIFFAILYGCNILIKLNLAFYDKGLLVEDKSKIVQNYIHKEAIYDFIGYLPILISAYQYTNPDIYINKGFLVFTEILFFCKMREVKKTTRFLEETLHLTDKNFAFLQLLKLLLTLLLFSNIMGCLWHGVSTLSLTLETDTSSSSSSSSSISSSSSSSSLSTAMNMLKFANYNDKDWVSRYLKCLFWTVNPGKVDPQNNLELFFGFFALLATSGSMGFMISGIHNLMRILGKIDEEKRLSS